MNDLTVTSRPGSALRSVGAVLAGLVAVVAITTLTDLALHASGVFAPAGQAMTTELWLLALAYRIVFGAAGGYITGGLAPRRPILHALVLGAVAFVISVVGAAVTWNLGPEFGPRWYPLAVVAIAIPTAWLGGRLHGDR